MQYASTEGEAPLSEEEVCFLHRFFFLASFLTVLSHIDVRCNDRSIIVNFTTSAAGLLDFTNSSPGSTDTYRSQYLSLQTKVNFFLHFFCIISLMFLVVCGC